MVRYCTSKKSLLGKTAIITGANSGIGYETALEFAKRACRVIMACRNEERANQAKEKIVKLTGNENVIVKIVDMESLDSIKKFAKDINDTEARLDILVNNAGSAYLPDKLTADGLQLQMAVNYFSPFLLTHLLLDLLKKSAPSRIVNVSSAAAQFSTGFEVGKVNEFSGKNMQYCKSKLAQILFTKVLAKKLANTGVTTYSLHPGAVHTEFQSFSSVLNFVAKQFFKSAEEGAQTQIYLAIEDGIEQHSGRHFEDCKVVSDYRAARSDQKAQELWDLTEKLVGLKN